MLIQPDEQHSIDTYVGIDNGVSGTIAVLHKDGTPAYFSKTPVFNSQDYTKQKKRVNRISTGSLYGIFRGLDGVAKVFIERPMVNPRRFVATGSALRALEATLVVLENCRLPYMFLDSREWQNALLPGHKGSDVLKRMSKEIGLRLFPCYSEPILKHGDADGLLIAEYARRRSL